MPTPTSGQNSVPDRDGQITRYISPEVQGKSWFNPAGAAIFVNGMANSGMDHMKSAMNVSLMLGVPVTGVFNKSAGFVGDVWQCLTDKLRLAGGQALPPHGFEGWARLIEAEYQIARRLSPGLTKVDYVGGLLGSNAATQALYRLLTTGSNPMLVRPIYCHSQGNLIVSNALTAVALARGTGAIAGQEVNSFGSPSRYWPPGLNRTNYAFTFDFVSMLDLRADLTSSKVGYHFSHGFPAVHGFDYYAAHDGEFVVNRFRFGGWGMTLNMDEKGLAKFCVAQGTNIRRLRAIFDRLERAHPTDSDDVAVAYVEQLSDAQIKAIKQAGPDLVTQLIRLLRSGITMADERRAIERLEVA